MKYKIDRIWWLILAATCLRILIAISLDLGNDEVYYWTYAQRLQWNYFDHPPMVAWLVRLTTANLFFHNELVVRLGAILSSAACSLLIYKIGLQLYSRLAGWYAALLYTASFYCGIIAGTFILPDSPQMFFWLLGILILIKIDRSQQNLSRNRMLWVFFGAVAGLCMMCKVHGIFLWVAVGIYAAIWAKGWWKNPWMYIAGMISIAIISPIIIWNFQNNFITYAYHESRVVPAGGVNILAFFREIFGEIFYNNPFIFVMVWGAVWSWQKNRLAFPKQKTALLICCSLPLIFTLLFLALFRDTLPHWSGPAYSVLIILVAIKLAADTHTRRAKRLVYASLLFFLLVVFSGLVVINWYPGTLGSSDDPHTLGKGDVTLDLYGWEQAGQQFAKLQLDDVSKGMMKGNEPIIINKWFPAAHIDFYLTKLTGQQTYGIGPIFDLHQYYFYNKYRKKPMKGNDAYFVTSSNIFSRQDIDYNKLNFTKIEGPLLLPIYRNGRVCKNLIVYRLRGFKGILGE